MCSEPGCGTYLASRNPAKVCWVHGGWDGRELPAAARAFIAAIGKAQPKLRPYEPSLIAMRRWQRKWGKHAKRNVPVEEMVA